MGIILAKSKTSFDELIGPNSFDDIFKNSIRDYYTYGFKSYDQFSKGSQIVKDRWKVFSKVLGGKWYFEKRKNGRNQIVLKTTPFESENPVDDLYFMHNLNKIGDYLNYLIDLDKHSLIRGGIQQLPVEIEELEMVEGKEGSQRLEDVDSIEFAIISNWESFLDNAESKEKEKVKVRINRQLNIWSPRTRFMPTSYSDKYANLSNRTDYLYELGILCDLRDDIEKRNNWLQEQWETYDSSFKKYFSSMTSGNHYWYKSPITMQELCKNQLCNNEEDELSFFDQMSSMCRFFSNYYPLGELGSFILKRIKRQQIESNIDSIRFKHNYLQKTLYDYNLIDILIAIENGYLCHIEYSHGINLRAQVEIVVPLEIRISVTNGREYVMYYHVSEKKIKALRLEFIDKITMYSHVNSIENVQYLVKKQGKKLFREEIQREVVSIDKNIAQNVIVAHQMLQFVWGTEVPNCSVTDDWRELLVDISLPLIYKSDNEQYIVNRLNKESRSFKSDKRMTIFPTKELRNWLRSFYKRIDISTDEEIGAFCVAEDVNEIWNVYHGKKHILGDGIPEYKKRSDTEYKEYNYLINGDMVSTLKGHEALFNEVFSKYAVVLADSLLAYSSKTVKEGFDALLARNIDETFDYYSNEEKEKVHNELKTIVYDAELINDTNESRFIVDEATYLFDVLPLTKMELRWLLTVLQDPLAKIFLSGEQIESLINVISNAPYEVNSFSMESIIYFDRYNLETQSENNKKKIIHSERHSEEEISFIRKINNAIRKEEKLNIKFKNWRGDIKYVSCAPVWIEYSRRDDTFRLWFIHNQRNRIQKINISRILSISVLTNEKFSVTEQQVMMNELFDKTMTSIKVEFFQGDKNLPDRLLTEFSLWKRKCVYDSASEKYTMTLHYSILDEKEILIRLLSYGPYIRILADEDNFILSELKDRIKIQRDLIQEREFKLERR